MEIVFANKKQYDIAEMMWAAEKIEEVHTIIQKHGHEAQVVYEMIVAATIDEDVNKNIYFPQVEEIVEKLK